MNDRGRSSRKASANCSTTIVPHRRTPLSTYPGPLKLDDCNVPRQLFHGPLSAPCATLYNLALDKHGKFLLL